MYLSLSISFDYHNKPANADKCGEILAGAQGCKDVVVSRSYVKDKGRVVKASFEGDHETLFYNLGIILQRFDDEPLEENPLIDAAIEAGKRVMVHASDNKFVGRCGVVQSVADGQVDVRFDFGYQELFAMFDIRELVLAKAGEFAGNICWAYTRDAVTGERSEERCLVYIYPEQVDNTKLLHGYSESCTEFVAPEETEFVREGRIAIGDRLWVDGGNGTKKQIVVSKFEYKDGEVVGIHAEGGVVPFPIGNCIFDLGYMENLVNDQMELLEEGEHHYIRCESCRDMIMDDQYTTDEDGVHLCCKCSEHSEREDAPMEDLPFAHEPAEHAEDPTADLKAKVEARKKEIREKAEKKNAEDKNISDAELATAEKLCKKSKELMTAKMLAESMSISIVKAVEILKKLKREA